MKKLEKLKVGDLFTNIVEDHKLILIYERLWMFLLPNGYILFCSDAGNGWYEVLEINNKYLKTISYI